MAEDLNKQLDDLSRNLTQMIDQVNTLSAPAPSQAASARSNGTTLSAAEVEAASQMPDDPVNQLSAILGAHLRALGSIEQGTGKLEGKVEELEGRMGVAGRARR